MTTVYMKALRSLLLAVLALSVSALAQGLDPAMLLHPPADSWPGYHGDYSGRRHSSLTQITPQNVAHLGLSWIFQTGQGATIKSSPLLVNGVIYFTVPDNVWAVDARSGHPLWHYAYPKNNGFHIGQRGVAMYKDSLYFLTPDAHLLCLNAKDGKVRWNVVVADANKATGPPWRRSSSAITSSSASLAISITSAAISALSIPRQAKPSGSGTLRLPSARPTRLPEA